jgi:hypothetical protein
VILLFLSVQVLATETIPLKEHPELKTLYAAANRLYHAALCKSKSDQICVCNHQDEVRKSLNIVVRELKTHPNVIDTYIQAEDGALNLSEQGRGVLIRDGELTGIQYDLDECAK